MERKDTHSLWIDLTLFVAVLGFSLFSGRWIFQEDLPKTHSAVADAKKPGAYRSIASVNAQHTLLKERSTKVIRVSCSPQSSVHTEARLLQIEAELCLSRTAASRPKITATNKSSGESILLFPNWEKNLATTSYFALQEGKNEVELVVRPAKGTAYVRTLFVEFAPAAK